MSIRKMRLIVFLIILFSPVCGSAQNLSIYTETSGDAQMVDAKGKLTGSVVEIFEELQKRAGSSSKIEVVPWARGYKALQENPDTILFSVTRTPEREKLFKWVGPVLRAKWYLYARKGSGIKIKNLEDAKKVKWIGTYKDDAREQFLKQNGFANLDSISNNETNIKKLVLNRVDLIILTNVGAEITVKNAGHTMDDIEAVYEIKSNDLYIAFSSGTSDETVKKWRSALDAMKKDGSFKKIYQKWYPGEEIPQ